MNDLQTFQDAYDGVKKNLETIEFVLDQSPDILGTLSVDEYFFLLDLMRVRSYHVATN